MMAQTAKQVVILSGTGFIGRRLVESLSLQRHGVGVLTRVRAPSQSVWTVYLFLLKSGSSSWPTHWAAKG